MKQIVSKVFIRVLSKFTNTANNTGNIPEFVLGQLNAKVSPNKY